MTRFKLGLVQMNTRLGDVKSNLEVHLERIDQAREQDVDLLVFPELSLTGYSLMDMVPEVVRSPEPDDPAFGPLLKASRELDLLVGFVQEDRRHRFYIAAAYLSQGELLHVHRKVYLPTYGLFQEGRFFAWGDRVRAFDSRFGRVGVLICEDFWHVSPPYLLWLDGAEIFYFMSASPSRGLSNDDVLGSERWVERLNRSYASLFQAFVAHTNRVGFEDDLKFGGRATTFDPEGDSLALGPFHEEALVTAELDLQQLRRSRVKLPLLRDERTELVRRELERIVANNVDQPT